VRRGIVEKLEQILENKHPFLYATMVVMLVATAFVSSIYFIARVVL
jgi:hypothetical protein